MKCLVADPFGRNMRARYLKHGDAGGTRATFLLGCLKLDIKELPADSPFQRGPAPVDHISTRPLLTSKVALGPPRVAAFFTCVDDSNGRKKAKCGLLLPPPRAPSLRISPLRFLPGGSSKGVLLSTAVTGLIFISTLGLFPSQENGHHSHVQADG